MIQCASVAARRKQWAKRDPSSGPSHYRLAVAISLVVHACLAVLIPWVPTPADSSGIDVVKDGQAVQAEREILISDIYEAEAAPQERIVAASPLPAAASDPDNMSGEPSRAEKYPEPASSASSAVSNGENESFGPARLAGPAGTDSASSKGLFQVPGNARSVVYVIDRSGSMGQHGRLALARRELELSLRTLPESARFQVVVYNRHAELLRVAGRTDLVRASAENISQATEQLDALVAEGGTDHLPALKQALLLHPDVIFFLTDADDLKPEDVRTLTQLNAGRTAIHSIELNLHNRDRTEMPMHRLADCNRGQYRAVELTE
jgi:hypothetical protein